MAVIENDRLLHQGEKLLIIREQQKKLDNEAEFVKETIYEELMNLGTGYAEVLHPNGETLLAFKNNLRFSKAFDKDGLSAKVNVNRTELDYAGVSQLVERGRVSARTVAEYQAENKSQFVTVRQKVVPKKGNK